MAAWFVLVCRLCLPLDARGVAEGVGSEEPMLARAFVPSRPCFKGLPMELVADFGGLDNVDDPADTASLRLGAKADDTMPASRRARKSLALRLRSLCARLPSVILSSARSASCADDFARCPSSCSVLASLELE